MRRIIILSTSLACAVTAVAGHFEFPKRKAGQWEITISSSGSKYPPRVETVCLDQATDELLYQVGLGASQKLCGDGKWSGNGSSRIIADMTCQLGGTRSQVHAEITLNGDSAYHEEVKTVYEPPLHGKSELHSTQDAKWVGACPTNMKPGDVIVKPSPMMPMSLHMNLNDMLRSGQ